MAYSDVAGDARTLDLATSGDGTAFSQQQHQQYRNDGEPGDGEQQQMTGDFVTDPLRQLLLTDMSAFFRSEVAPRSAAINDVSLCWPSYAIRMMQDRH